MIEQEIAALCPEDLCYWHLIAEISKTKPELSDDQIKRLAMLQVFPILNAMQWKWIH